MCFGFDSASPWVGFSVHACMCACVLAGVCVRACVCVRTSVYVGDDVYMFLLPFSLGLIVKLERWICCHRRALGLESSA